MKKTILRLVALLSLAVVCGAFYGLPTAKALRIQPVPTLVFLVVLLLAPIIGRFFCSWLCPLGILQSVAHFVIHPKTHVRRVCTRLPETRAQQIVRWVVFAIVGTLVACGLGGLGWVLTPYSIVGKALVGFVPGIVLAAVVLLLATIRSGRIWCNWVCPVGTLFNLLARRALLANKIDLKHDGCGNCRKCFAANRTTGKPTVAAKPADEGVTRREALSGFGVLAVAELGEKTVDGGFAPISLPGVPARPAEVLPPGAVDRPLFQRMCVGCDACVAACPEKCLVPSMSLKTFGQPKMDFRWSHCRIACPQKCAAACPAGALRLLDHVDRRDLHMGHAIWKKDLCLRTKDGTSCTACQRKCPVKAITLVGGFPVVDRERCIGCGACEHVCPSRPMPAIFVKGFDRQRVVRPFSETDLIAEMTGLVQRGGAAVVAARGGVIGAWAQGRGVQPILSLLDSDSLNGAIVVDKVIGRAAAAVAIVGRARHVHGLLMGEDAKAFLESHGVRATAGRMVTKILNRDLSASCPMEATVGTETEPEKMVAALRGFVRTHTPPPATK